MENDYMKTTDTLRRALVKHYIILTWFVRLFFMLFFLFMNKNHIPSAIFLGIIELSIITYSYILISNNYNVKKFVSFYFIIGPLTQMYTTLHFWKVSQISLIWFILLPFGAYIFFSKKITTYFFFYTLILIICILILGNLVDFKAPYYSPSIIRTSDVFNILFATITIFLGIFYYDKIKKSDLIDSINKNNSSTIIAGVPSIHTADEKVLSKNLSATYEIGQEKLNEIFDRIESEITNNKLFTDENLTIAKISASLNINIRYISLALRSKGYINFSNYLNLQRVSYVKQIMSECDLEKMTLMYIYTTAGFSSQTTFNRVFKNLEGITPSEYIIKSNYKIR